MTAQQWISVIIFLITMSFIMTERLHRAVAAIAGVTLLVLLHVLTVDECASYVDINTIGVLVGMMLFVAVVKNSGIFEYIAIKAAKLAKGKPWSLMVAFALITAVLSAFLDNVTTVLLIGPMTLAITGILNVNPVPYMMTQILASNIGGTATLIGDPPNIMIGSAAGLSFADFVTNTGAAVVAVFFVTLLCFWFIYGRKLKIDENAVTNVMKLDEKKSIKDRALMTKSIVMIILVALAFILHGSLGLESSTIALTAAVIMLIIGRQDAEEIIFDVEWSTILFFIGLFITVGGLKKTGVIDLLAHALMDATNGNIMITMIIILWVSAIVSAFLDNIPFVATLIPMILTMQSSGGMDVTPLWWALSLGACLGGNGTLVGASANVVLSGISAKNGHPITFKSYLKTGFPLMLLSIIISTVFLMIKFA